MPEAVAEPVTAFRRRLLRVVVVLWSATGASHRDVSEAVDDAWWELHPDPDDDGET